MLRQCTAVRAVIAEALRRDATGRGDLALEELVRELAAIYADHPDYEFLGLTGAGSPVQWPVQR